MAREEDLKSFLECAAHVEDKLKSLPVTTVEEWDALVEYALGLMQKGKSLPSDVLREAKCVLQWLPLLHFANFDVRNCRQDRVMPRMVLLARGDPTLPVGPMLTGSLDGLLHDADTLTPLAKWTTDQFQRPVWATIWNGKVADFFRTGASRFQKFFESERSKKCTWPSWQEFVGGKWEQNLNAEMRKKLKPVSGEKRVERPSGASVTPSKRVRRSDSRRKDADDESEDEEEEDEDDEEEDGPEENEHDEKEDEEKGEPDEAPLAPFPEPRGGAVLAAQLGQWMDSAVAGNNRQLQRVVAQAVEQEKVLLNVATRLDELERGVGVAEAHAVMETNMKALQDKVHSMPKTMAATLDARLDARLDAKLTETVPHLEAKIAATLLPQLEAQIAATLLPQLEKKLQAKTDALQPRVETTVQSALFVKQDAWERSTTNAWDGRMQAIEGSQRSRDAIVRAMETTVTKLTFSVTDVEQRVNKMLGGMSTLSTTLLSPVVAQASPPPTASSTSAFQVTSPAAGMAVPPLAVPPLGKTTVSSLESTPPQDVTPPAAGSSLLGGVAPVPTRRDVRHLVMHM